MVINRFIKYWTLVERVFSSSVLDSWGVSLKPGCVSGVMTCNSLHDVMTSGKLCKDNIQYTLRTIKGYQERNLLYES